MFPMLRSTVNRYSNSRSLSLFERCNLRYRRTPISARHSTTNTSGQSSSSSEALAQDLQAACSEAGMLERLTEKLSSAERQKIASLLARTRKSPQRIPEPSQEQLRQLAFVTAVPFVGFGFMDNAILIIAGDAIDTSLGVMLGISTMCAAAIGNIVSDVAGILMGTAIEDFCSSKLGLHQPPLTTAQRNLRSARFANQFGCAVGIVIGCIIGMVPLWFIDSNKIQARKRQAVMDGIFQDVVDEAGSLIGAQTIVLFLVVDAPEDLDGVAAITKGTSIPAPTPDGTYLYARYARHSGSETAISSSDRIFYPLGRGIVSRAALTGEVWNIRDVMSEPDHSSDILSFTVGDPSKAKTMLCVPVFDAGGRVIAVLQAVNKVRPGLRGDESTDTPSSSKSALRRRYFSNSDVQVLKALASHISVSLQRNYDEVEDDLRLKDTIRMLKEYGLAGLDPKSTISESKPQLLFPEESKKSE